SFAVSETPSPSPRPEELISLKHCIRVLNGFGRSLEVVLPKLRDGYIAPDSTIARNLALENPDAYFLSSTGECFHNVTVTGGKQRKEGPLSLKRELRDVMKLANDLEAAIQNEQNKVQLLARELGELAKLLSNLEEDRREAEKQALTSGHALKQMEPELERTDQRMSPYRLECERTRSEREQTSAGLNAQRQQAAALEEKRTALESEIQAAREQVTLLKTSRDAAAQSVAEAAARLAGLEERRRLATAAWERIESLSREAAQRVESLQTQIQSAGGGKKQARAGEGQDGGTPGGAGCGEGPNTSRGLAAAAGVRAGAGAHCRD